MSKEPMRLVDYIEKLKENHEPEKTRKKGFNDYIEIIARKKKVPLNGKFELTPLCNLDCKMCYVHLNSTQFRKDELLPVETWKKLVDDAHATGMLRATLTGGECLTYPGFDELYLYMLSKGIVPSVMSNGLLINEKRVQFFKKYPPTSIQITLYGSSDEAYEKVTGHRVFNTIYHNIEMLRDSHFKVFLTLTPSAFMRDDIRPLQEAAESLGIPYSINANLVMPRDNTGRALEDLEVEQYIEIYKIWKEIKKEQLAPVDPAEIPDESSKGESVYGLQCGGGSSSFTIQYNGKMAPCPSMWKITTEPLQDGFVEAWHQLNEKVRQYPMPMECTECVYKDCCISCPAIHANAKNPGHCNPQICQRTKRMVREGFIPLPGTVKESK